MLVVALLLVGYRFGSSIGFGQGSGAISVSDARECLLRGGTIYFNVTFGSEAYLKKLGEWESAEQRARSSQAFMVNANTHTGTIKDLSLEGKVYLLANGVKYPSSGDPLVSTTHHNTYLVFFPKFAMDGEPLFDQGTGSIDVLIEDVQFAERLFTFGHPLPGAEPPGRSLVRMATLVGSALAALLVACTPCLVGSLAVGSLTVGTVSGPASGSKSGLLGSDVARKTLFYLAALSVAYLAVAVAVSTLDIDASNLRPIELVGGLLLLGIGLSFLRHWWPALRFKGTGVALSVARRFGLARPQSAGAGALALGSGASSAMGVSLALVCSVAGAPTLSTAILLPVMVYAGLSDLYWSIIILVVYLAVCSVPFFLISVGLGEFLMNASVKMRKTLLTGNAFLLMALGVMLLLDPQRVADYLAAPADVLLSPFTWIV